MSELATIPENGLATTAGWGPAQRYLITLDSQASRDTMRKRLDQTSRAYLPGSPRWYEARWETLTADGFLGIKAKEKARGVSRRYVNQLISAIKGVVGAAFDRHLIGGDHLTSIMRVKGFRIGKELSGRFIPPAEQMMMIRVCFDEGTAMGKRDCAILATMFGCGLRRLEVRALNLADLDRSRGDQFRLLIRGKGDKERHTWISGGGLAYMVDWLEARGNWDGPLFVTCDKFGRLRGNQPISDRGMYGIFQRRAQQAGVEQARPHDARRSACTSLLQKGVDPFIVSRLLGHSKIETTLRYDLRPEEDAREASRLAEIEYLG